ncbi:hypothetical protein KIN20_025874 [Parelaphostrongylus tenuis]|uniref:Uncharacterized protein n=1 Tax=Parelaphostrongylus tenuis TaxID=148309 RepID=A0AAD5QWU7_PARTN|nr:hypothetical protein KIN20_025874 [Parelaphostrongylus tenuis]
MQPKWTISGVQSRATLSAFNDIHKEDDNPEETASSTQEKFEMLHGLKMSGIELIARSVDKCGVDVKTSCLK